MGNVAPTETDHDRLQLAVMNRWVCWYWWNGWKRQASHGFVSLMNLRAELLRM